MKRCIALCLLLLIPGAGALLAQAPKPVYAGWLEGWGNGSILSAVQPGTTTPCDLSHPCVKTAEGVSEGKTFFDAGGTVGRVTFNAVLQFDFTYPTPNGNGAFCYPVGGQLSFTTSDGTSSTLVMNIQGTNCLVGSSTTLGVITGTYVVDGASSSGKYLGVLGVGAFHWTADASVAPAQVLISVSGNLHFPS